MAPKTQRRHRQGDETRQRLLDAAIELAAERGYDGATVALIAKRADVSMSSIYWHFASKDQLLAAVIDRSFAAWAGDAVIWTEPPGGVRRSEHIAALMAQDVVALTRNPDFLRLGLMLSLERREVEPAARQRFIDSRKRTQAQLRSTFRRLLDESGVDADDRLVEQMSTLSMAAADGLFIASQIDGTATDLEGPFRLLVRALLEHTDHEG